MPAPETPRRRVLSRQRILPAGRIRPAFLGSLFVAALILTGLWTALSFGPQLLREPLLQAVSTRLGRGFAIEQIRVSPLSGVIELEGLRLAGAQRETPMVSLARLRLVLDIPGSLDGTPHLKSVLLEAPRLSVVRAESGAIDLVDLIEGLSTGSDSGSSAWTIDTLSVRGGTLHFEDRLKGKTTVIQELQTTLAGLSTQPEQAEQKSTLTLSLRLDDSRPIRLRATGTPFSSTPTLAFDLSLDDLALTPLQPYLSLPEDLRPHHARVSAQLNGHWRDDSRKEGPLTLSGQLKLDGLVLKDSAGRERVSLESVTAEIAQAHPLGGEVHLRAVKLIRPFADLARTPTGMLDWPVASATDAAAHPRSEANLRGPQSLRIDQLMIDAGRLHWTEGSLPLAPSVRIDPLALSLQNLIIPDLSHPEALSASGKLDATLDGRAPLKLDWTGGPASGQGMVAVQQLDLARVSTLLGAALPVRLQRGGLDGQARIEWQQGETLRWALREGSVTLADGAIGETSPPGITLKQVVLSGITVDSAQERVSLERLRIEGGAIRLRRTAQGELATEELWRAAPTTAPAASESKAPWNSTLARAEIAGVSIEIQEEPGPQPLKLPVVTLDAIVTNVTTDPAARLPFDLSLSLPDNARLQLQGRMRPAPLELDTQVRLQRLPLAPLVARFAPDLGVTMTGGALWGAGRLQLSASGHSVPDRIQWKGELSVNEARLIDKTQGTPVLSWSALALPASSLDWSTRPKGVRTLDLGQIAFVDFAAQVELGPDGKLNLSRLFAPSPAQPVATTTDPADTRSASESAAAPQLRIEGIQIASGAVSFTDRFIQPSYSAHLTRLYGSIGAIRTDASAPSDLLITGRVDDETPLEITGLLNPLAPQRFIDLRAVGRGFDLPQLSPYSGRWAGYAIEKGKLTADVRYRIEGDRLSAQNRLFINQLTFGKRIESPEATSLPVLFAVSLLKDREGNIDLDLPISGTLDDPQFSVGSLLGKALGNLLLKTVSSPFTALASLVSGHEKLDLSQLEFAPGAVTLDPESRQRLDALGKALQQRPSVSLEITGYADPLTDREAIRRAQIEQALSQVPAQDRPGAERRLIERTQVGEEEVLLRARQRALAARDYLRDQQGIAAERLFLLAPRLSPLSDTEPPRRAAFKLQ